MRILILSAAALTLAACNETETPEAVTADEEATAASEAPVTGDFTETSWEWTNETGELRTTSFGPDGSYTITSPEGETVETGNWMAKPGLICMDDTTAEDDDRCWQVAVGDTAVDASQEISNDAGETLTVTRREYEAPTAA